MAARFRALADEADAGPVLSTGAVGFAGFSGGEGFTFKMPLCCATPIMSRATIATETANKNLFIPLVLVKIQVSPCQIESSSTLVPTSSYPIVRCTHPTIADPTLLC